MPVNQVPEMLRKSPPNANCAAPRMKIASPKVAKICTMPRLNRTPSARAMIPRYTPQPSANMAAQTIGSCSSGSSPVSPNSTTAAYIASISISPWAKLTTSISPKIRLSPAATSA